MAARSLVICALVLATGVLSACRAKNPLAVKDAAVRSGDELMAAQRYPQAVAAYSQAVRAAPNDGALRLKLARAHEQAGQWTQAAGQAMNAADLLPTDFDARFLAARLILGQSRFDDSLAITTALLRERPGNPDLLVLWGTANAKLISTSWALFKLGPTGGRGPKYDEGCTTLRPPVGPDEDRESEAVLRDALAGAPESIDVALALINFLWAARRADESAELVQRTADRAPHGLANEIAGHFFLARGQHAIGEKYLEIGADASASYSRAPRLALADHYLATGRFEDARRHLDKIPASEDEGGVIAVRKIDAELGLERYDTAALLIDAVLARYPTQRRGLTQRSQLFLKTGKATEAVAAARKAVAADLAFAEARVALAAALAAEDDSDGAFIEYSEALRLDPTLRPLIPTLARLALETNRNRQAEMFARQAVGLYPDDRNARLALVTAQVRRRNHEAATVTLAPLMQARPRPHDVQIQLGLLEAGRGNDAAARLSFEAALKEHPASIDAIQGLVDLDLNRGRLTEAHERVTQALAAHRDDVAVVTLASRVFRAAGDARRAEPLLRTAMARHPNDARLAVQLAECLVDLDRADDARLLLERALSRQSAALGVRTALGGVLERLGRLDDARAEYERVLSASSGDPAATAHLALVAVAQGGNLDQVLGRLTEAEPDFVRDADIRDALGWVYLHVGMPARAVQNLEVALRANPQHPRYQYHLGVAYARRGETAKARLALSKALAVAERFAERGKAEAALAGLPK